LKDNTKIQEITVQAHENEIVCMSISQDGKLIATASKKGTLIRVFDTSGKKVKEFRRGSKDCHIVSISFDAKSKYVACTSSKGTVHVFRLEYGTNSKSALNFMGKLGMNYFESEWSFAKYRLHDKNAYCGFGPEEGILLGINVISGVAGG